MGTTTSLLCGTRHKLGAKKSKEKRYGLNKKQMQDLAHIVKVLQLTWAEVDRFHSAFNVLDLDRDGTVDRLEFTKAVGIEANDFARECFHIITPKSRMNFVEFIAACTKICIANFENLCRFAFRIIDVDCNGVLDKDEIDKVVKTIYGTKVTVANPSSTSKRHLKAKAHALTALEMLSVSDANNDGSLSVGEFVRHARKFPQIIKPAHNLQIQLRRKIIGPCFWERRSEALARRYDLLAAGMFQGDWAESGIGDWWGVYDQKWRHYALDDRDSLDTPEDRELSICTESSGCNGKETVVGGWKRRLSNKISGKRGGGGSVAPAAPATLTPTPKVGISQVGGWKRRLSRKRKGGGSVEPLAPSSQHESRNKMSGLLDGPPVAAVPLPVQAIAGPAEQPLSSPFTANTIAPPRPSVVAPVATRTVPVLPPLSDKDKKQLQRLAREKNKKNKSTSKIGR